MKIYKITNLVNKKIYIGQTSKDNEDYLGSGKLIKLAVKKYGKDNFRYEEIENCTSKKQLNEREIFWISHFRNKGEILYNISDGGTGGNLGEQVNKLISLNRKGKRLGIPSGMKGKVARNKGIPMSEEQKQLLRKSKTEVHRRNLSVSHTGKILSDEHKESLSLAFLGNKNPRATPIKVYLTDGSIIEYELISQFLKEKKISWYNFRKLQVNKQVQNYLKVELI